MRSRVLGTAALAALLFAVTTGASDAVTVASRQLVYNFTWGTQSDLSVHTSGINGGDAKIGSGASGSTGTADFRGGVGDRGTITVELLKEQPDKGLILKVSEQAENTRSAPAATCVVYGTTGVICDPNATLNPEEMALIRLLGSNFVDPNSIDAKRHWRIADTTPEYSLSSDFTIAKDASGLMTIDESREIREQQPTVAVTNINTTIGYDFNRTIPITVDEYSIARSQTGMDQYQTVKTQIVLRLKSDSLEGTRRQSSSP